MSTAPVPKAGRPLLLPLSPPSWRLLLSACGTPPRPAAPSPSGGLRSGRSDHRARGRVADRGVHPDRQGLRGREPGHHGDFSFGSSATLATQIIQGAPADVFAAASPATMKTVTDAGAAEPPTNFVSNTLQIAVPKGNPGRITGLKDFADESKQDRALRTAGAVRRGGGQGLRGRRRSSRTGHLGAGREGDPAEGRIGEVDAALVYRTDVIAAGDKVDGIEFPEAQQAVNDYPIAALKGSKNPARPSRSSTTCFAGRARRCSPRPASPSPDR